MNELKLSFKSEIIERFQDYIQSKPYTKEQDLTEHWGKRQKPNHDAFRVQGNSIVVNVDVSSGLSYSYPLNFGKSNVGNPRKGITFGMEGRGIERLLAPVHRWKQTVRRRLLWRLGCYTGVAYDPMHYFNKHWPREEKEC